MIYHFENYSLLILMRCDKIVIEPFRIYWEFIAKLIRFDYDDEKLTIQLHAQRSDLSNRRH